MSEVDRREFLIQAAGALTAVSLMPTSLPAALRVAEPIRVGVVGVGRQGRAMLDELAKMEGAKVVAIADVEARAVQNGLKRAPGAAGFASHAELLDKAKDVQAILVATPTHLHKQAVLDSLAAGKHVYGEAPFSNSIDESRDIARAARGGKGVFAAGLEGRCNPVYQLARTFFRSDAVRDLIVMRAQAFQKTSWRVPASDAARDKLLNWRLDKDVSIGLPGEWGTHQFDVCCWYRDQYPTSVQGSGAVLFHEDGREVPDTAHCDLAFADKRRLLFDSSLASSFQGRHELLHGSNATIKLAWSHGWMFKEADAPTQGWEVYANRQQFHNDEGITLIAGATKLAEQGKLKQGVGLPETSLHYSLHDFLTAIAEGKQPASSAEAGHRATVMGIAAHQAVVQGKAVEITPEMMKV